MTSFFSKDFKNDMPSYKVLIKIAERGYTYVGTSYLHVTKVYTISSSDKQKGKEK